MASNTNAGTLVRTEIPAGSAVVVVVSSGAPPASAPSVFAPAVTGMSQADALGALQQAGLNAQFFSQASETLRSGTVIAQWPRAGESTQPGGPAVVLVSSGAPAEGSALLGVPNVIGQPESQAHATLQQSGLRATSVQVPSATVPAGVVLGQLPEERSLAPAKRGSAWVWIVVALAVLALAAGAFFLLNKPSVPAEMVKVPQIVGESRESAEQALTEAGLAVGTVTESPSTTATAGDVMSQDPVAGTEVAAGSRIDITVATKSDLVEVPDVVGMSRDAAMQELARAQLEVGTTEAPSDSVASGNVISQSPKAGQMVPADTEVGIVVSSGAEQTNVNVPNVVGLSKSDATSELSDAGLKVKSVDTYSDSVPSGEVIGQAPPSGASVAPGTVVALLVSAGPPPAANPAVNVPDVVGMSLADAKTELANAGLKATSYTSDGSGKPADEVLYQTPAGGESAPQDSQVVLVVSSGN